MQVSGVVRTGCRGLDVWLLGEGTCKLEALATPAATVVSLFSRLPESLSLFFTSLAHSVSQPQSDIQPLALCRSHSVNIPQSYLFRDPQSPH